MPSVVVTVSNCSSAKGDSFTGVITGRFSFLCLSSKTLCENIALFTVRGNFVDSSYAVSITNLNETLRGLSLRFKRNNACVNSEYVRGRVESLTITSGIDPVTAITRIHDFISEGLERFKGGGHIIVSNESVKAAIFPSTRLGVFVATRPLVETREETTRVHTGKSRIGVRSILGGLRRESCVSSRERISPLIRTTSTVILSGSCVAVSSRVT